jgi:ribosome-associated toxin RatA of RatAB toxin-antitoxin module
MREITQTALVAQPPARLFEVINDIEDYPRFIPWVRRARVLSRSATEIVATLAVQRGPLSSEFTTRNELEPEHRILMHLVDGPFSMLEGEWLLTPIESSTVAAGGIGCRVQLSMQFEFRNRLTAALFEQKFAETAASLVDAFVARARSAPRS